MGVCGIPVTICVVCKTVLREKDRRHFLGSKIFRLSLKRREVC